MFGDLLRQIYRAPLILIRSLVANPLSFFVYGIMSKWYMMVMLATIMVTFWVFKGLEKSGALQAAQSVVSKALVDCKSVAQNCTPLIMDLGVMWDCIQNPPAYEQNSDEIKLENDVNEALKAMPKSDGNASSGNASQEGGSQPSQTNPYDH